jgi:menaquinone-dependent protoporphyrinogen IX oxidase
MDTIAVIYRSKYGSTRRYAEWIAEELGADLLEHGTATPGKLAHYDAVVYGGGLYAGRISGVALVTKHPCKNLTIFTVGAADPATVGHAEILDKNLPERMRAATQVFHLRGGIDYPRLGPVHRGIIMILHAVLSRFPAERRPPDAGVILDTYGKTLDFVDRRAIEPIVAHVRSLGCT